MSSKVAVLKTSPRSIYTDIHELMNLAGYQDEFAKDVDTALKINISWHFFYPGSSTTVAYHDSFWYPFLAKKKMAAVLESVWGRLFRQWETLEADEQGFPEIGAEGAEIKRTGFRAFVRSLGVLLLAVKEAPEFATGGAKPRPGSKG